MIKQSEASPNETHHSGPGREWAKLCKYQLKSQSGPDPKKAGRVNGHEALG